MSEIAAASVEQSHGIDQVTQAVAEMDRATQHNAAHVEEVAAAAQSLDDQSKQLVTMVATFVVHDDRPSPAQGEIGTQRPVAPQFEQRSAVTGEAYAV
jgi:methyl-accepting chemotaxis protein